MGPFTSCEENKVLVPYKFLSYEETLFTSVISYKQVNT
jgi:hypothetical protein